MFIFPRPPTQNGYLPNRKINHGFWLTNHGLKAQNGKDVMAEGLIGDHLPYSEDSGEIINKPKFGFASR